MRIEKRSKSSDLRVTFFSLLELPGFQWVKGLELVTGCTPYLDH